MTLTPPEAATYAQSGDTRTGSLLDEDDGPDQEVVEAAAQAEGEQVKGKRSKAEH